MPVAIISRTAVEDRVSRLASLAGFRDAKPRSSDDTSGAENARGSRFRRGSCSRQRLKTSGARSRTTNRLMKARRHAKRRRTVAIASFRRSIMSARYCVRLASVIEASEAAEVIEVDGIGLKGVMRELPLDRAVSQEVCDR